MLLEWLIVAHGKVPVQFVMSENCPALDLRIGDPTPHKIRTGSGSDQPESQLIKMCRITALLKTSRF
jgi:hypothetical protein